ncbi:hypothetical protein B0H34DRAFT_700834 [Crassisporium funariophilum]|nr:hypothetical protein B0H34DRAFT_700834 [Crassisporium funariophilum]
MVDIYLPEFITQGSCDHPDLVHLISQWAISPAFKPSRQVFCLLGNEGCGKTQLAGNIMESFNQLGFLGAYFTFDLAQQPRGMTSKQLLDSLPVTVAHQLSSVIPDIASHVAQEIKNNAMIQYDASLDNKFERLLTKPLAEVAAARAKVTVKPVEPLIFVIDDLDKCTPEVLAKLLAFFKGVVFKNLPSYVRFLLLGRPSDLVDQGLKDVAFVHEMVPIFEPSLPFVPFSTRAQATSSSSSSQGVRISGGWSLGTPYTGKDKYDPSGHLHLR